MATYVERVISRLAEIATKLTELEAARTAALATPRTMGKYGETVTHHSLGEINTAIRDLVLERERLLKDLERPPQTAAQFVNVSFR